MSPRYFKPSEKVPFATALRAYRAAHAAYLAGSLTNPALRMADERAFEHLADSRIREDRPWRAEDYR